MESGKKCTVCGATYCDTVCNNCKTAIIPHGVTEIEDGAFKGRGGLKTVCIPDSVTHIGDCAFEGCNELTSVLIPYSVKFIGTEAFARCPSLTDLDIQSTATAVIGNNAFAECTALTSVMLPDDVSVICGQAFFKCTSLQSVILPKSLHAIGHGAFSGCDKLENIYIDAHNSVYAAVNNCIVEKRTKTLVASCKTSVIPTDDSITALGAFSFEYCSPRTELFVPKCIKSIDKYAFFGSETLEKIVFENANGWYTVDKAGQKRELTVNLANSREAARYLTGKYPESIFANDE